MRRGLNFGLWENTADPLKPGECMPLLGRDPPLAASRLLTGIDNTAQNILRQRF
jgi:hypothetical protein